MNTFNLTNMISRDLGNADFVLNKDYMYAHHFKKETPGLL
jgi:hypothetical protein